MGVSFYKCDRSGCGTTFNDVGYYEACQNCGAMWCGEDCAEADGLENTDEFGDKSEDNNSCNFCREEDADDLTLLKAALRILGMTREELVAKWRES